MVCRTHQKNLIIALLFVGLFSLPMHAIALDLSDLKISVDGFGTVCASKSDLPSKAFVNTPVYPFPTEWGSVDPISSPSFYRPSYNGAERRWTFLPNSKFALQFTSLFSEQYKAVVQIIGRAETMTTDHYTAKMDWAYVQYNRGNNLDVQVGRFRIPAFYYSDYLDVNNAQPWVAPPEEVYYIVGGAFRNMDGIKARFSYYFNNDLTFSGQAYFGSMQEKLFILFSQIDVSVRDVVGVAGQLENDYFTIRGSVMRSVYDTNLYSNQYTPVTSLLDAADEGGVTTASSNLRSIISDKNQNIVYVGLAAIAHLRDDLDLLVERASIRSPGIISTARLGWYSSLTYSLNKFAITGTYGFTEPLGIEVNKYNAINAFVQTAQYQAIDKDSGAGTALAEAYRSYLGKSHSYALDLRYDIMPSVALKGSVKYIKPTSDGGKPQYLYRQPVDESIWVYRLSIDFVF